MKPLYRVTNPGFKYVPACATDIRAGFKKRAQRLARAWNQAHAEYAEREAGNVQPIRRKAK